MSYSTVGVVTGANKGIGLAIGIAPSPTPPQPPKPQAVVDLDPG